MASLRRIASLDRETCASSNPGSCIIRQSSLPNLFLGQPELSMKARTSSRPRKSTCQPPPLSFDFPSLHSHFLSSQLPLFCRALSTHSFDELPVFDIPTTAAEQRSRRTDSFVGRTPHGSQRKEVLLGAGKQSLDLEKSIVYNELKESMWKFEAPPRFLKPSHIEGSPCAGINTHIHTHTHEASKPMKNSGLCMDSCRNDVIKGRPLSLQMLKRKLSPQAACDMKPSRPAYRRQLNEKYPFQSASYHDCTPKLYTDAGDSVSSALASLFFIMKMLQEYAHSIRMRSRPSIFESDDSLVGRACAEMLDSFLWLFQQVFSCTPRLMLLTMVLLADFTLHSMSMHVAFPVNPLGEPQTLTMLPFNVKRSAVAEAAVIHVHTIYHPGSEEKCEVPIVPSKNIEEFLHGAHNGGVNGPGHVRTRYRGIDAADPLLPQTAERAIVNGDHGTNGGVTLSSLSSSLLHHVHEKPSEYLSGRKEIDLDVPTKRMLVAPVRAPTLEADDYPCFDRTDLAYQREIGEDPTNPLLLANYAQFLHLVRHDYGRAEELYKKAVSAEAEVDGEVMGRFASFLWVAKGNVAEADRAYKAAVMADPTNAFHAGNYAHFLWNSSASQAEELPCCIINNMNNTSEHIPSS